ncbi:MAG: cysteine hydrolase [Clostridia bacterium]|nr:cysteine hydrolase [Clostridia bacterium]
MKVLCVIDMQNDFIDGALGSPEAQAIVGKVKEKINLYRRNGDRIIFTRDTHTEDYLSTAEGRRLPVVHCVKGTKGWEISDELDTEGCEIIDKPTFGSYELAEAVAQTENLESVELLGLCTDICVISNAMLIKARLYETPVTVDGTASAGVTPESHRNALESMKMCQIDIVG